MGTFFVYTFVVLASYILASNAVRTYEIGYLKKAKHNMMFIILILSFVSGFRGYSVGTDTQTYAKLFLNYGNHKHLEVGFRYFIQFLMQIMYNPTFVFVVIAIIINGLFIVTLWKYRDIIKFNYSVLIYSVMIYFLTFSGVRQYLVVALCFYCSTWMIKGKIKGYLLYGIVCIASTLIHTSSLAGLLLIPIFYLAYIVGNKKFTVAQFAIGILGIFFCLGGYTALYTKLMNSYAKFLEPTFNTVSIGYMVMFKTILLFIAMLSFLTDNKRVSVLNSDEIKRINNKGTLIAVCLMTDLIYQVICYEGYFFASVSRIGWYYLPFEVLLYSKILERFREKRFFVAGIMILTVLIYSYYVMFRSDGNSIIPYVNVLW